MQIVWVLNIDMIVAMVGLPQRSHCAMGCSLLGAALVLSELAGGKARTAGFAGLCHAGPASASPVSFALGTPAPLHLREQRFVGNSAEVWRGGGLVLFDGQFDLIGRDGQPRCRQVVAQLAEGLFEVGDELLRFGLAHHFGRSVDAIRGVEYAVSISHVSSPPC